MEHLLEKNLENATVEDLKLYKKYSGGYDYESSGLTYSSDFMWGKEYNLSWEIIEGYLWKINFYEFRGKTICYSTMPMTLYDYSNFEGLKKSMKVIADKLQNAVGQVMLKRVPEQFLDLIKEAWEGEVEVIPEPYADDYVYEREKLATLEGPDLHKKKNHLNFFQHNFEYKAEFLKDESDIIEAVYFTREVNNVKEEKDREQREELQKELNAIERALREGNVNEIIRGEDKPDYMAFVIKINDKIQALAIGCMISDEEVVVHSEKATMKYRGIYQAICSEFAKNIPSYITYINREEDMGIEGLKKSKEGYRPCKMQRKFLCILK